VREVPPADYVCCITGDLFEDPVVTADGHSYSRNAITRWLSDHDTSPKTGAILQDRRLVPNHSLRAAIEQWRTSNGDRAAGAAHRGPSSSSAAPPPTIAVVEPKRGHPGIFVGRGATRLLLTRSMLPGESVYGEELINTAFRVWDPTRSVLAAAILGGINSVHMGPGAKVLYLGAGSGVTASHISDIVDEGGCVYAVEVSPLSGSVLENVADRRPNLIPIIADARNPQAYCSLVGTVDCIFADIAQLDQARIVVLNANLCLKVGGHIVITMKASIHANSPANARTDGWNRTPGYPDYGQEVNHFRTEGFKPVEMITLEPYYEGNAVLTIQRSSVLRQG